MQITVKDCDLKVWAIILSNSPPLLSVGRLCRENGCRFVQEEEDAHIVLPNGKIIQCEVSSDVPYVTVATKSDKPELLSDDKSVWELVFKEENRNVADKKDVEKLRPPKKGSKRDDARFNSEPKDRRMGVADDITVGTSDEILEKMVLKERIDSGMNQSWVVQPLFLQPEG